MDFNSGQDRKVGAEVRVLVVVVIARAHGGEAVVALAAVGPEAAAVLVAVDHQVVGKFLE